MEAVRNDPYKNFHFRVYFGGIAVAPSAGFEECAGIDVERSTGEGLGDRAESGMRKIVGINKITDVTLKRGVVRSSDLNDWLHQVREGTPGGYRTVFIELRGNFPDAAVRRFRLERARIVKHTSGPLNAGGTDVAIQELVLSCEGLNIG